MAFLVIWPLDFLAWQFCRVRCEMVKLTLYRWIKKISNWDFYILRKFYISMYTCLPRHWFLYWLLYAIFLKWEKNHPLSVFCNFWYNIYFPPNVPYLGGKSFVQHSGFFSEESVHSMIDFVSACTVSEYSILIVRVKNAGTIVTIDSMTSSNTGFWISDSKSSREYFSQ